MLQSAKSKSPSSMLSLYAHNTPSALTFSTRLKSDSPSVFSFVALEPKDTPHCQYLENTCHSPSICKMSSSLCASPHFKCSIYPCAISDPISSIMFPLQTPLRQVKHAYKQVVLSIDCLGVVHNDQHSLPCRGISINIFRWH